MTISPTKKAFYTAMAVAVESLCAITNETKKDANELLETINTSSGTPAP